jgi:Cys-tRNA synthase (O-phospho-L-seryl-tRNA:Cys-tRNA synthase)
MVNIFLKDNTATNSGIMQVRQSELGYDFIVVLQDARDVPQ